MIIDSEGKISSVLDLISNVISSVSLRIIRFNELELLNDMEVIIILIFALLRAY
jgi:hypothetical protein